MATSLYTSLGQLFLERVNKDSGRRNFFYKSNDSTVNRDNGFQSITFSEFYSQSQAVALGLLTFGLKPGERVAILSGPNLDWSVCEIGILGAKGVVVPIEKSLSGQDILHILSEIEAKIVFVENADSVAKLMPHLKDLPFLERLVVFEPIALKILQGYGTAIGLKNFKDIGMRQETRPHTLFDENLLQSAPDEVVAILYTQGTSGHPKGVLITHENILSVLDDMRSQFLDSKHRFVSFDSFAWYLGFLETFFPFAYGWEQYFAENSKRVFSAIVEAQPTLLFAKPWFLEIVYRKLIGYPETGVKKSEIGFFGRKKLVQFAMKMANRRFSGLNETDWDSVSQFSRYSFSSFIISRRLSEILGKRLKMVYFSGGLLLPYRAEALDLLGVKITQFYGLTETAGPVASMQMRSGGRSIWVGRPFSEVLVRIGENGEIQIKSKKVTPGYFKNSLRTDNTIEKGWLHTGDLGDFDDQGGLSFFSRIDGTIRCSDNSFVDLNLIERLLKSKTFIEDAVLFPGEIKNGLKALLVLRREEVVRYADANQIPYKNYNELLKTPKIQKMIQSTIDACNRKRARNEKISEFQILSSPFSQEDGEITPGSTPKRAFLADKYHLNVNSILH